MTAAQYAAGGVVSTIRHVLTILAVHDLELAIAFYQTAFRWTQSVRTPVYAEFDVLGGMRLGLYERNGFGRNTGQIPSRIMPGQVAPTELYFYTDDIEQAIYRMRTAGACELSALATREWGDEAAYFADPDGNVLVLARKSRT